MRTSECRRVVVTGIGVVSPVGLGVDVLWDHLRSGRNGVDVCERFDMCGLTPTRAGEIRVGGVDWEPFVALGPVPLASLYGIVASEMALVDAGVHEGARGETATCLGSVMGMRPALERHHQRSEVYDRAASGGLGDVGVVAQDVAAHCRLGGMRLAVATACAVGNTAIALAYDHIRAGVVDRVLVCGTEELSFTVLMEFKSFRALAAECVRPFDRNRDGVLLSEGAAALVLEPLDWAATRGATVYGEVLGHGSSCDAHHMTAPHPRGAAASTAMQAALGMAERHPSDVDYINAHGTGTPRNDSAETVAIHRVFGDRSNRIPVSSVKGSIGHMQGAAGTVEAAVSLLALKRSEIPPTANYEEPDPECDLRVVSKHPLSREIGVVLSNSFGFGGTNSSLVLGLLDP